MSVIEALEQNMIEAREVAAQVNKLLTVLSTAVRDMADTLDKISDPRKRDHQEPDDYTKLGCVMNMATEALERNKDVVTAVRKTVVSVDQLHEAVIVIKQEIL